MKSFLNVTLAEATKQYKSRFHSYAVFFSMLLWPFLNIYTVYFSYKPFENLKMNETLQSLIGDDKVFSFILLGYLSYMFFSSFIHSAWDFSNERIQGTLEMIYLTPASRLGVLLGNALSSLVESMWLFSIFCCASIIFFTDINISNYMMIFIAVLVLVIPSICWGVFLNSIFLFARDTRTIFSLLYQPLELLSGVKFPFYILPLFGKTIGIIFPLTWSLFIIRDIFMSAADINDIKFELFILGIISILLIIISIFLLKKGEEYIMKTGNSNYF